MPGMNIVCLLIYMMMLSVYIYVAFSVITFVEMKTSQLLFTQKHKHTHRNQNNM